MIFENVSWVLIPFACTRKLVVLEWIEISLQMQKLFSELSKTFEKWINFPPWKCESFRLDFLSLAFFLVRNFFLSPGKELFYGIFAEENFGPLFISANCSNGVRQHQSFEFIKLIERKPQLYGAYNESLKCYKLLFNLPQCQTIRFSDRRVKKEDGRESFKHDYSELESFLLSKPMGQSINKLGECSIYGIEVSSRSHILHGKTKVSLLIFLTVQCNLVTKGRLWMGHMSSNQTEAEPFESWK